MTAGDQHQTTAACRSPAVTCSLPLIRLLPRMLLCVRGTALLLIVTCCTSSAQAAPSRREDVNERAALVTDPSTNYIYAATKAFRVVHPDNPGLASRRNKTTSQHTPTYYEFDDNGKLEEVSAHERENVNGTYNNSQDDFQNHVLKSLISDHVARDLSALEQVTDQHIFEWVRNTTEAHAVILARAGVRSMLFEHKSLDFAKSFVENAMFDQTFFEHLIRLANFPLRNVPHLWNFRQLVTMDAPFLTLFCGCWTVEVESHFVRFFLPLYDFIYETRGMIPDHRTFDDLLAKLLIDSKVLGSGFLGGPNNDTKRTWQRALEEKAHQFGGVWNGNNFQAAPDIPREFWF